MANTAKKPFVNGNRKVKGNGKGKKGGKTMTASDLYGKQNKLFHRAFEKVGFPYNYNKGYWAKAITALVKREVKGISELSLSERSMVLSYLSRRGADVYNPHVPRHWSTWTKGDVEPKGTVSKRPMHVPNYKYAMVKKIHAILADMKLPWSYVDKITRDRFDVQFVEWLDTQDMHKIVQMMSVHQLRHGGPRNYGGKN